LTVFLNEFPRRDYVEASVLLHFKVSYPQYLRLIKLQEKVIKLNQMIEALHGRYTHEQLDR
jgi:hypothetical protein